MTSATSPFLLLLLLLLLLVAVAAAGAPIPLLALLSLKSSLVDPLSSLQDWSYPSATAASPPPWCSWSGVTCSATGEVTALDLSRRNLSGAISPEVRLLYPSLAHLNLSGNAFCGPLPPAIFDLRRLQTLDLSHNDFNSSFSAAVAGLRRLTLLDAYSNSFTGPVPSGLAKLRLLEHLNLGGSFFEGGSLSQLEHLEIGYNSYKGGIPPEVLDLSDNRLSGSIPRGLSSLTNLTLLSLMNNALDGAIPPGIGELPNLEALLLWNNSLSGALPEKLGSGGRLEKLDVSSNSLSGPIPPGLCSGNRLVRLILFSNRFDSEIPSGLANCSSLWRIRIEGNRLSGAIPSGFGSLPNLTYMDLSGNNLSGGIPPDLGTAPRLEFFNVSGNPLRRPLPETIWSAPRLQILSASYCDLYGEIPSFEAGCRNLYKIEMEGNDLRGEIPTNVGRCLKLLSLKLGRNRLTGTIPLELAALPSITDVDLSWNGFTGPIPPAFDNCSTLESFNVSFNHLAGEVPSSGAVLRNLHPSAFAGNAGLCGGPVGRPCAAGGGASTSSRQGEEARPARGSAGTAIVWIAAGAVGAGLVVLILGTRWFRARGEEVLSPRGPGPWRLTAFQRLNFTAEDVADCVAGSDRIIGVGSMGTVYRAEMPGGEVIAVKKLWGPQKEAGRTIKKKGGVAAAEVEVLGSVRHRNIVRLLGCCTNREATLLLYEYMPNGSLEDLLHRRGGGAAAAAAAAAKGGGVVADWETRYRIAVGIAQGICYLHHDCDPVIVHRDLKPSNILLDAEMDARVADFGVAKLIQTANQTMSVIAGSYGYIAPEYAYTLQVDERSDVYSYGVVLMEMVTGRRSVEAEYGEGNSIVECLRARVGRGEGGGVWKVLDPTVAGCKEVREEMMLVLRLALLCTSKNPADRPTMRDVLSMLREAIPSRKVVVAGKQQGGGGGGSPAAMVQQTVGGS
ncbi:Leucine-rich repeat receptor-like protein kinase TDR [Cocos nucifera]|uniref:non-specific serine/threonine protein kinase n=1 Tax=Cocos nucifera TaxID=13894 RepID=A0A8K0II01_COCNU|nr:Leucine-rich repeat receptor-like protein kinase TDR [Cocos nucifera]